MAKFFYLPFPLLYIFIFVVNTDEPKLDFDTSFAPVAIDLNQFHGCLHQAKDETDKNCWGSPSGQGFMVRGKTYLNDFCKVVFQFQFIHFSYLLLSGSII